ncbi:MAG: TAXI family TRAP transporter solute-binding subunit [Synergistaceae bacterium]|jgi:TRAP transporter TAXI family solute receptor|nr:TAXI family TRAP transporter solute-binding subunit [Synergistaceae bacterium]
MKKFMLVLLSIAMISIFSAAAGAATFINIGTGSTGGTYYPVGSAMASIWNRVIPDMRAASQSTGGTAQNLQLLENGEAEVAFTDGLYYFAYNGLQSFEGKPQKHLRGVAPLYPEPIQFMVAEGSGITSIKDLKGKRVGIGAVASGTEQTARALLKVAGIDPDSDIRAQNLGLSETASALADKNIDAGFMMAAIGSSALVEVTTIGTGHLIALEDDLIAALNKELPYYSEFVIPAGSYKGQDEPLKVAATWNTLTAHEKLDTDLVYQMTKALFENKQDLVNVAANMSFMDSAAVDVIRIPLHPGAEKYYKEIGAIK